MFWSNPIAISLEMTFLGPPTPLKSPNDSPQGGCGYTWSNTVGFVLSLPYTNLHQKRQPQKRFLGSAVFD